MSLIMRPGFSTTTEVTHTSGRGVGMDVVKESIEKLNGTVEIENVPGAGACFRIKIPLTLAIIPALLVRLADDTFTIPLATVEETIRIHRDEVATIEGVEVFYLRDATIPLIRLRQVLIMDGAEQDRPELFVVVVNTGVKQVGLVVDELRAQQEVVIKPIEDYLQEKSGFSGATLLGDGSISLILNVFEIVELSLDKHSRTSGVAVM
jgi:two-component system, chemotaxis family, sensor kinase CheA